MWLLAALGGVNIKGPREVPKELLDQQQEPIRCGRGIDVRRSEISKAVVVERKQERIGATARLPIDCQRADWVGGNHRLLCKHLPRECISDISTRERALIGFSLHRDYVKNKYDVFRLSAKFIAEFQSKEFYVEFDYTSGEVVITVLPADKLYGLFGNDVEAMQWGYDVARMTRSAGRIRLNVARIGAASRYYVFPLRSATTTITAGIVQLAMETSSISKAEYEARLNFLVDEVAERVVEVI
ncbi:hypothetical protein C8R43DRAFT_1178041 [Mycena crocata]|nr:hypothetical protein C8R43DRAFT_1178041 [Mycena crocata]